MIADKQTSIVLELDEALPYCAVDASQMQQVIMNLVTNASEALGNDGGSVSIRTGRQVHDAASLAEGFPQWEVEPGEYVFVEVVDNGMGMNEETRRRLFEPFFTTKFTGRGLGLAAVGGIVKHHHGALGVETALGEGSRFVLLLPVTDQVPHPDVPEPYLGDHSGCILVVDDEPLVRRAARRILRRAGYEVVEACDGAEAIEVVASRHVDAVLLDMTMPRMSGEATYLEIRRLHGDVPIVLSSGYNEQEATNLIVGQRGASFLQKPYLAEQLLAALVQVKGWKAKP